MHKIIKINTDIIDLLIDEIKQYKSVFPILPFDFHNGRLSLNNISDRDILKNTFEVINSSIVLSKITCQDLDIKINDFLNNSMLWTYPQIRIDCDANKQFSAPLHKDGFILGDKLKGIIIWLPISSDGGSLEVILDEGQTIIKRNENWGLECICNDYKSKKISINYGEALIFDENVIHRSCPKENGQVTLQLRYFEPSSEFFYRPVVQKSANEIIEFQNQYK